MQCTNKSGVKYFMGQLIQFITYAVLGFAYQKSWNHNFLYSNFSLKFSDEII